MTKRTVDSGQLEDQEITDRSLPNINHNKQNKNKKSVFEHEGSVGEFPHGNVMIVNR